MKPLDLAADRARSQRHEQRQKMFGRGVVARCVRGFSLEIPECFKITGFCLFGDPVRKSDRPGFGRSIRTLSTKLPEIMSDRA